MSPEEERELGSEGTEVLLVGQSLAPFKRPRSLFSQSRSQPSGLECKTQDRVAGLCRERLRSRCRVGAESGFANASSRHPQSTGGPRHQDPARGAACRAWEAGCFVIDPRVTLGREPLLLVALALSACWKAESRRSPGPGNLSLSTCQAPGSCPRPGWWLRPWREGACG